MSAGAIKMTNDPLHHNDDNAGTPGIELPEDLINGYKELNEKMDAAIVRIQQKRLKKKE